MTFCDRKYRRYRRGVREVRAVIDIGKAQMVQLADGGWETNGCVDAPRNPWDADQFRVAGGSSSGLSVALAAGFADLALDSDTGGSIRIPASLCGIVGLKPSQGRVSLDGVIHWHLRSILLVQWPPM